MKGIILILALAFFLAVPPPQAYTQAAGVDWQLYAAKAGEPKAFHDAVQNGEIDKVKAFLKKEPSLVNSENLTQTRTPLAAASLSDHAGIVRLLLEKGAPVNAKGSTGDTALHWAAQNGNFEIAEMLVKAGAKVNVVNKFGVAPLYWAAANGHLTVVKLLVGKGAKVNVDCGDGLTPLKGAIKGRHMDVAEFLKSKGAK